MRSNAVCSATPMNCVPVIYEADGLETFFAAEFRALTGPASKLKNANLQLEVFILQFSISCSVSCNGETGARHFRNETCAKE